MNSYYFYRRRYKLTHKKEPYYFSETKTKNYIFGTDNYEFIRRLTTELNMAEVCSNERLTDAELIRVITVVASYYHSIKELEVNKEHSIWKAFN